MENLKNIRQSLVTNPLAHSVTSVKQNKICETCGESYITTVYMIDGKESYTKKCRQCINKQREKEDNERFLRDVKEANESVLLTWGYQCNVQGIFIEKTFDNFKRELQSDAFDSLKTWNNQSIVLCSPNIYGVGKTHLVCALINELIKTRDKVSIQHKPYRMIRKLSCPAYFTTETQLLNRIRKTFNNHDGETEDNVYKSISGYDLLVIDDVGKVRPHDYSFLQGVYFNIIDDRYTNGQFIILTTNLDLGELEKHIGGANADRLREMCGKNGFIKMAGESYRKQG